MVAFDAALFLVVGILLSCRRVVRSFGQTYTENRLYGFGPIGELSQASVMREARENSAVQGNEADDKCDRNQCQQISLCNLCVFCVSVVD